MAASPSNPARLHHVFRGALLPALLLLPACSSATKPGDLTRVQPVSDMPRAGNVYLLRGWIGIFSTGINQLGDDINASGVRATVYQEDQWPALAAQMKKTYAAAPPSQREPIVLIGHSYGADSVIRIASRLAEDNIPVDLIITLDPVTPPPVPANVRRTYNLYQSNGVMDAFPWLRGIPVEPAPGAAVTIQNMDIRRDRTDLLAPDLDHFNIEKQPLIHADILKQILLTCPPRNTALAAGSTPLPSATRPTYLSTATPPAPPPKTPAPTPTPTPTPTQGRPTAPQPRSLTVPNNKPVTSPPSTPPATRRSIY